MARLLFVALVTGILGAAAGHAATGIGVYYSGNDYRELSNAQRLIYVERLHDGLSWALGVSRDLNWMQSCSSGWESNQHQAVLKKYLDEHPEHWDRGGPWLYEKAMQRVCRLPASLNISHGRMFSQQ